MKTCPDCAESVQDAARKCRYCGYRFDSPPAADASPIQAAVAEPEAPAPDEPEVDLEEEYEESRGPEPAGAGALPASPVAAAIPGWPYGLVAAGGALVAAGGLFLCMVHATGVAFPLLTTGAFVLGGILLASGWGCLILTPGVGIGAVLGSLVLSGTWAGATFLGDGPDALMLKGLIGTAGLLACALSHLGTLELQLLDGARLAALAAAVGFGAELLAFSKKLPLPGWAEAGLYWTGMVGTVLFGIAILVGGIVRLANPRTR